MDFDSWAQLGNSGWGFSDVLPYFKRCEEKIGEGDELYRGRSGILKITDLEWRHPLCDAFIKGANSIGIPTNTDYNGANQEGVSYVQRTTNKRRRVSSARAFLNPAKSRKNLTVYTNAHVTRILFEARRAIGVELKRGESSGQTQRISAKREDIL